MLGVRHENNAARTAAQRKETQMIVKSTGEFENAPPGMHVARCISLIDLGTQTTTWQTDVKHQRKVRLVFELPETKMNDGRPFTISRRYTLSLSKKSALRRDLVGWRGREFSKEEEAGFELKNVLGAPAFLNCVQDGEYVNVSTISPLPKKTKAPKQVNPSTYFSLDPGEFDPKVYAALGESTKEIIAKSPEFQALTSGGGSAQADPQSDDADRPPTDGDDDIPF